MGIGDYVRWFVNKIEDSIAYPNPDDKYLNGIFGPVSETSDALDCEVQGEIPKSFIGGQFMRNGPNPAHKPRNGYHWFDGDGMVHAVKFKAGNKAAYSAKYVNTLKLQEENRTGGPQYMKFGDLNDRLGLVRYGLQNLKIKVGVIKKAGGVGNTSLQYHAGRLLALHEADSPYVLKMLCDGVLETIGALTFDGKLQTPFTAHPKSDPETGYLYAFGYQLDALPHCTFHVVAPDGELERSIPITGIKRPIMMHDFAVTKRHAIFLDFPLVFNHKLMAVGKLPFEFQSDQEARFGILPLDATDDSGMQWFTLPASVVCFHVLNAWESAHDSSTGAATKIDIVLCQMLKFDLGNALDREQKPCVWRYTMDLVTSAVTGVAVVDSPHGMDFPQLNRTLMGRPCRYGYCVAFDEETSDPVGFVKLDMDAETQEKALVSKHILGEGLYCSECLFVPDADAAAAAATNGAVSSTNDSSNSSDPTKRASFIERMFRSNSQDAASAASKTGASSSGKSPAEDDGYLVMFVLDQKTPTQSQVRIYNAKTMSTEPVAVITIPSRVPMGFHGLFVSASELASQKKDIETDAAVTSDPAELSSAAEVITDAVIL